MFHKARILAPRQPWSVGGAAAEMRVAAFIAEAQGAGRPVRVHVGPGAAARGAGWLGIDAEPGTQVITQLDDLWMVPDESIDIMDARAALRGMDTARIQAALNEWKRVLRPGGRLHLRVPRDAAVKDFHSFGFARADAASDAA